MLSASQLRSARALLDLSQGELTERLGIGVATLSNIEKGKQQPSADTARRLQSFFEESGLEFLDHDGVRRRPGDVVLVGEQGLRSFFDDVYRTAKAGGEIVLFNGSPAKLLHWAGSDFYAGHAKRMAALGERFSFRIIVCEDEHDLIAAGFARYRWFPKGLFSEQTVYVHGDTPGRFHFGDGGLRSRGNRHAEQAATFRVMFGIAWEHVAREFA